MEAFFLNSNLNIAIIMTQKGLCDETLDKIDKINSSSKILGPYGTIESIDATRNCVTSDMTKRMIYSRKGLKILEKSLLMYPDISRLWILAGNIASDIAAAEEDVKIKEEYFAKSYQYFKQALVLSPKSQEIILGMAHLDIIRKDCQSAIDRTNQCIDLDSNQGKCYWAKGLSLICNNSLAEADENFAKAKELNFIPHSDSDIQEVINAYIALGNYEKGAEFYELLVKKNYYNIQYRASLAEAYRLSEQYDKARETALKIIEVSMKLDSGLTEPEQQEIKKTVNAFLQALPQ